MKTQLFVFVVLLANAFGAKLPDYLKRCDLKDAKLNDCMADHANQAIPLLVKGDASLGIPVLSPLTIPKVELRGERFTVTLTDVSFDNFKDMVVTESEFDLTNNNQWFVLKCKYLNFTADYTINDGQILSRTLSGDGKFEMSLVDNTMKYSSNIVKYLKGGQTYLKSTDSSLNLESQRAYFKFENVWTDDDDGDDIYAFLQENWKVVQTKVQPGVERFIKDEIDLVMAAVQENISIEDSFIGYP